MSVASTYTQYLPPVLWESRGDPGRMLDRSLRIYERILTGIPLSSRVTRTQVTASSATGGVIACASPEDAARFRAGDFVTIVGTAERAEVQRVQGPDLFLVGALAAGPYAAPVVRIADLVVGQRRFRLDERSLIQPGSPIRLQQGPIGETAVVESLDRDDFATLDLGLTGTYGMSIDHMPVNVSDGVVLTRNGRPVRNYEKILDDRAKLLSPWRAPDEFLPWLAQWVALPLRDHWSDYQRRYLISKMVEIYRLRGLKRGMYLYLDIHTNFGDALPRFAIDDGEALIRVDLDPVEPRADLHEIAHAQTVTRGANTVTPLLAPVDMVADTSDRYFVLDQGHASSAPVTPPAVWSMSNTGELPYAGTPALPAPLLSGSPLQRPAAIASNGAGRLFVANQGVAPGFASLIAISSTGAPTIVASSTGAPSFTAAFPVDLLYRSGGDIVVLDRGHYPLGDPPQDPIGAAPSGAIIVVRESPLTVTRHPLPSVERPSAFVLDRAGRYVVADARDQSTTAPARLFRVDPAAGWSETSLLPSTARNPLVFPVGLAWEGPNVLLVLDAGVRWGTAGTVSNRVIAEDAALYRVDLSGPVTITRLAIERRFVSPQKLRRDAAGRYIGVERGEALQGTRVWRRRTNEFGVNVLFSNQRATSVNERNQILRDVVNVVAENEVVHTQGWIDF